jgi:hypothetical protein
MSCHSEPRKPQSIIHHIGRLGLKVVKSLSRLKSAGFSWGLDSLGDSARSSLKSVPRVISKTDIDDNIDDSARSSLKSIPRVVATTDIGDNGDNGDNSGSCSVHENCAYDSADEYGSVDDCIAEEIFETLDQNQFLVECFMSNERSDITFLVHFFNEDSALSDEIEEHVSRLVLDSASRCQCRRVNASLAPLFTAKLGIDPEQPTLVSIQNGAVIDKLSNFSSPVRSEVEEWIKVNDILNQLETGSFSNLSTDF